MPRALWIAPLTALLSTTCGWGDTRSCDLYHACCKAILVDATAREVLENDYRCRDYQDETSERICEKEWARVLGTAGGANLPIPQECEGR